MSKYQDPRWSPDFDTVVLSVFSPPDHEGKHGFDALWWDHLHRRQGQCFRANLEEAKARWASSGFKVEMR